MESIVLRQRSSHPREDTDRSSLSIDITTSFSYASATERSSERPILGSSEDGSAYRIREPGIRDEKPLSHYPTKKREAG
jgi:hypothetical protein